MFSCIGLHNMDFLKEAGSARKVSQREKMLSGTNEVTGENSSIEGRGVNIVRNYQKELDKIIEKISACRKTDEGEGKAVRMPRLLLHACCAPCSSYCLEYLRQYS